MSTVLRRAFESLLLIWLVVSLTFLLAHAAPGDPAQLLVPPGASAEDIATLRSAWGLDDGIASQYVRWSSRLLRGDLGVSFARQEPVTTIIGRALPISAALGLASIALTFAVGVVLGLWQALHAGTRRDRVATTIGMTLYAAPTFWLALALVTVFTTLASRQGWPLWLRLPAMGFESPGSELQGLARLADIARHAVLPVLVLSVVGAAGIARYARAGAIELLGADWARTARAKGLSRQGVVWRHVFANARAQLIVLFALSFPGVVAGSVFVESVFAWPGMGRAMLEAISARDYPVIMGVTLVYAMTVIVANLVADGALLLADPRRRT